MSGMVILFITSVVCMIVALYLYENRDKQAYDEVLVMLRDVRASLGSNDKRIALAEAKVEEFQRKCEEATATVAKLSDELDVFRDQVAETREKQIRIREAIAAKRTKVEIPTGPIQIEVWSRPNPTKSETKKPALGKGIKEVIKEQKKKPATKSKSTH